MELQGKGPAKVVMDLDASLEVYEDWKAEEEARETEEVEAEVSALEMDQLVTQELGREVCNLRRSKCAIGVNQDTQDDVHEPAPEATSATPSSSDDGPAPETDESVSLLSDTLHHNIR